jgi:hypothetical protein
MSEDFVVLAYNRRSERSYAFHAVGEDQLNQLCQKMSDSEDWDEPDVRWLNEAALCGTGNEVS